MNKKDRERLLVLESRNRVCKCEITRLLRDKVALQADVTELRSELRLIASDIDSFIIGAWDGNEQGWEVISRRAQTAIVNSYHQ